MGITGVITLLIARSYFTPLIAGAHRVPELDTKTPRTWKVPRVGSDSAENGGVFLVCIFFYAWVCGLSSWICFFSPRLLRNRTKVMHLCQFSQEMDAEEAVGERGESKNPIGGMAVGWKGRKWNFIFFHFFRDVGIENCCMKDFMFLFARKWMNIPRASM